MLGLFASKTPIRGVRWVAGAHSLSRPSFAKAPYCALLSAQPRPAAGRATPWPGPPCDRPPQSASVEEVSRPPSLISPRRLTLSRDRQAPAPGSMDDPHDDTDVPSGTTDSAQME